MNDETIIEKPGVYVVIYRIKNELIQYLLCKRQQDWNGWEIVKGGLEKGESFEDAAPREVREELNINITLTKSASENVFYSTKEGIKRKHILKVFYGNLGDCNITLSEEHSESLFVELAEALKLLPFEDTKKILIEVDKEIKSTQKNIS
jgi:8-oxo-dGTP pyrophosphatase MutT (NUDIX family)